MSTSWYNLPGNLGQFSVIFARRIGTARRQRQSRCILVESLEQRALLSAANNLVLALESQDICVINDAADDVLGASADENQPAANAPALTFASLSSNHNVKQGKAKAKVAGKSDFSGDWKLGTASEPPTTKIVLHVLQVGKKFMANVTHEGQGVLFTLSGKVKRGEFQSDLTTNPPSGTGHMILKKVSDTALTGTIILTIPGQPTAVSNIIGIR